MRRFPVIAVTACVALSFALVAGACSTSDANKSASAVLTDVAVPHVTKQIGHVFVINLENENYAATWGATSKAKYLNGTLRKQGVLLTNYYAIGHVSLDNYIAEISGQSPSKSTQLDCATYTDFVATGTGANGQALGNGCVYPLALSQSSK